jgi:hypothetical protein
MYNAIRVRFLVRTGNQLLARLIRRVPRLSLQVPAILARDPQHEHAGAKPQPAAMVTLKRFP